MASGVISDADMDAHGSVGGGTLTDAQMDGHSYGDWDRPEDPNRPGIGEALLRGGAQGVTLGFRDEIAGALMALVDRLRGEEHGGYEGRRDEARAADEAARAAHPIAYGGARLAGSAAPLLIPGVAEGGLVRQAATMAVQGGLEGAGEANRLEDVPAEVARGAAAGGAGGAVGSVAGRALGAAARRLAPGTQALADSATVRAAGEIGADTGRQTTEQIARKAEFLRQGKFVEPFDTVGHVSEKLQAARRATNDAYGDALGLIDQEATNAGMAAATTDHEVAQKLREVAAKALADPATPRGATKGLDDIATELENRGKPMTMKSLDELKRRVAGQVKYQPGVAMAAGSKEVGAQAVQALRGHMLDLAGQLGGGLGPESLGGAVQTLLEHSAEITPLAKTAAKRTTQLMGQAPVHLGGRLGIAAGAGALAAGNPAGLAVIAAGMAAKGLEQRSNALIGTALNKLAKVAANPATAPKLGKWGGYVAAQFQRGPQAGAAAHYALAQNDPQYAAAARAVMNAPEDDGDPTHAPPLDTSIPVTEP